MEQSELIKYIGRSANVYVRYGFRKKTEEVQNYQGKLIKIDNRGIIIERTTSDVEDQLVHDFFSWHNIDAIRFRKKGYD